jgi:uncharacterized GH25 family protein
MVAVSFQASAHYLWIELNGTNRVGAQQEIRIYYGEFNEGIREIKGGRLEELSGIQAWVIGPDGKQTVLTVTTADKFFKTTFTPQLEGKYTLVAVNIIREVVDWSKSDIGIARPVYYTSREISVGKTVEPVSLKTPAEAEMLIRKIPSSENTFQVIFKGVPLANAKVFFHAPNEWSKELSANKEGIVSFNPLWKGQYIVECIYPEKTPGSFKGKDYQLIRHRATVTFDIP